MGRDRGGKRKEEGKIGKRNGEKGKEKGIGQIKAESVGQEGVDEGEAWA